MPAPAQSAAPRGRLADAALRAATEHPLVRRAQELFDATVVSVEPDAPAPARETDPAGRTDEA